MTTQRTVSVLAQHSASLKQVRFQPGAANNSVIATSSRDGSVQIWDLRCKGTERPVLGIYLPLDPSIPSDIGVLKSNITYGCVINSIYNAHRPALYGRLSLPAVSRASSSRGDAPGRIGDVSVTAITFLPDGREHMLLTASEANASVKLWDLRSLHNTRRKLAQPLSCTAQPGSHSQWRHFGINSLNLGGDGSRFYTLCKDNTVYVYSTAHLILGHAPELSSKTASQRRPFVDIRESLALYMVFGTHSFMQHLFMSSLPSGLPRQADVRCLLSVAVMDVHCSSQQMKGTWTSNRNSLDLKIL